MTISEYIQNGGYVDFVALTNKHMQEKKLSRQEIADRIGLSRSAVSQYLSGKYSNPESVEEQLSSYLTDEHVSIEEGQDAFRPGEMFYQSTDARRIMAVCSACQEYAKLGVIAGKSGYGKSHTLVQYAQFPKVAYIECDDTMGSRDLVGAIETALGMNAGSGTLYIRTEEIKKHLHKNPGWLLIIDEADKLISASTQKKMEILRKFVKDKSTKPDVGIVLAGEPQLIPLLQNYDDRLDGRGTCWYQLKGLTKKEAGEYISRIPMEDEVKETLITRACETRRGCFRRLDQTLDNIVRLLEDKGESRVTHEILDEASDMMLV